jgi:hypothetical protein
MLGVVEPMIESDEEKNRLCPPIAYWDEKKDYLIAFLAGMKGDRARAAYPALASWMKTTRLKRRRWLRIFREWAPRGAVDPREAARGTSGALQHRLWSRNDNSAPAA